MQQFVTATDIFAVPIAYVIEIAQRGLGNFLLQHLEILGQFLDDRRIPEAGVRCSDLFDMVGHR
jgi:hypothetical protein